jgi:ribonuclease HII
MSVHEEEAASRGYRLIAGVDEAGRGPLAGPVVAGAVIFTAPPVGLGIRDSKKLTPKARERLARVVFSTARAASVGIVWPGEIDRLNIHRASLLAMERAVENLSVGPDFVLVDGSFAIRAAVPCKTVTRGDATSVTIAAASILAKTSRDLIMEAYHRIWPDYGFSGHKGYPTAAHKDRIRRLGPTPIHRRSFRGVAD